MNWLTGDADLQRRAGDRFRALLARGGLLTLPGAYNGLAALQARAHGFEALYLSGAALSASMGLPDLGVLTIDDVCHAIRQITRASGLPLLVDGDTGYGGALNVMHMVRSFEDAGAAAVHIEDQRLPKKCGHLNDKQLVPPDEMAAKIAAAVRARRPPLWIARTDAAASEGLGGAISRARQYLAAGADAIFPEALETAEQFAAFARAVDAPLLANMTEFGRGPPLGAAQIQALGYSMLIWPVSALRVAARAQEGLYEALRRDGTAASQLDRMQTRKELYETLGYSDYEALDASLAASTVPPTPFAALESCMFYDPDSRDHGLRHDPLKACVVPRPIGWITTISAAGVVNLAPFSFFNLVSDDPAFLLFSAGTHGKDRGKKDTVANIEATGEFVYNMATWAQRDAMNRTSQITDRGVDELRAVGLEPLPSRLVRPPRVRGAPVHFECRLHEILHLPGRDLSSDYYLVIGRVVGVHIEDDALTPDGRLDLLKIRPIARLGYKDYAVVDTTFEMERPLR